MVLMIRSLIIGLLFWIIVSGNVSGQGKPLIKLRYEENYTPTYEEIISMYQVLDRAYENAVLVEAGLSDCGKPVHLFVIDNEKEFRPEKIRKKGKTILLINNGIHPGEPEGIDASLEFADDILRNKDGMASIIENTVIVIIPVYNIGGHLNRSAYNRSGQTTPYETGFRGNYANLDLNRDFTKCDSRNALTFSKIFNTWDPDVLLDTHTTNGSDHQYTITLISPPDAKYPDTMQPFIRNEFVPALYTSMKQGNYELIPYVTYLNQNPEQGIYMEMLSPRYSNEYAALFHSIAFITENQIYKAFPDRVKSCYQFIRTLTEITSKHSKKILELRRKGISESMNIREYSLSYKLDTTRHESIEFKGYQAISDQISPVTGLPRFGYDRTKPFTRNIRYYDVWLPVETVPVPEYYILPQNYRAIVERFDLVGIQYSVIPRDTNIRVTVDYIEDFTSQTKPYNGHYYHNSVTTRSEMQQITYYRGDLIIPVRQEKIRYILEMLEPKALDSFFRWNFFDNILDQREYFSSYGFEDNARKYLDEHPEFHSEFLKKRETDTTFAKNHREQLAWIYNNTPWLEKTWKRYPVGKIFKTSE